MGNYKYPKLTILVLSFLISYAFFAGQDFEGVRDFLRSLGLLGAFLSGILYAYGFTGAIGSATFLIIAKDQPILLAGLIGGLGAVCGDMLIFKLVRHGFMDEMAALAEEKLVTVPRLWLGRKIHARLKGYFLPLIGAFIIASPLPDEIGVPLMAASYKITTRMFSIVSYLLNTMGILAILYLGTIL
jgi:uncharacterized membrane protein YdjX (TVP38/TMEM64 family)